jgi:hypothetical protein
MFQRTGSPVPLDYEISENFDEKTMQEIKCPNGHVVVHRSNGLLRLAKDKEMIFTAGNILNCEECHIQFQIGD